MPMRWPGWRVRRRSRERGTAMTAVARRVGRWLDPWVSPVALAVAIAPPVGQGFRELPLPYVLSWVAMTVVALVWHRAVVPRWWAAVAGPRPAALGRSDLCSLKWYVLAWFPLGGAFAAGALVLHHRLRARRSAGLSHDAALRDLGLGAVALLVAVALGQWGIVAWFHAYIGAGWA